MLLMQSAMALLLSTLLMHRYVTKPVYHQVFLPLLQLPLLDFKQQPDIMKYARVLVLSSYWRLTSLDLHTPKQLTPIYGSLLLVRNHQQSINDPQKVGICRTKLV